MNVYRRLFPFLRPYLFPRFFTAILCMLAFSATNGVLPFLVQHVFDDIFAQKNTQALRLLPLLILGTFLFRGVANFGHAYLIEYIGLCIVADLRNALNAHLQSLSLSYFHRTPTGTILSRVTNDTTLVREALTQSSASIMRDATTLIALIIVAFLKDWFLASLAFIVFPITILPLTELYRKVRSSSKRGQGSLGRLTALLQETIQGNRVVKAFSMEAYERERFARENQRLFQHSLKAGRLRAFVPPMVELVAAFGVAAVVWYGGSSVISGERTQGAFVAFLTAMLLLYEPFKHLTRTNAAMQNGLAAAERLFEVFDQRSEVEERPHAQILTGIRQGICFTEVSFRYQQEGVLRNINLEIRAGEVVALVGPSGGGKSTLADLIPRFYDVNTGQITIDGVDVRDFTLQSLRAQIAVVTQFTFLFNDTARNNIAYGGPSRSLEEVIAAAQAAHAHEFIMALPEGYDTEIGELGARLSGGQRQRLAIARALLKNAPILILDEATSSLDNESERLVQAAIEELMVGRTVLVIAHRLSTIQRADRILVLVNGQIVEEGRHDELLAHNAQYRRLYDLQFHDISLQ
ncbi:MAG TPA: ABC transporter transmembrane domain-containing protein [Candidatus Binatia bacterium]|jgi:subfamily B ATP-binding cassette protein MsbA|nr:ABC transporter transmembrane domain-containing protein [Candidatus Binatia bacterium]